MLNPTLHNRQELSLPIAVPHSTKNWNQEGREPVRLTDQEVQTEFWVRPCDVREELVEDRESCHVVRLCLSERQDSLLPDFEAIFGNARCHSLGFLHPAFLGGSGVRAIRASSRPLSEDSLESDKGFVDGVLGIGINDGLNRKSGRPDLIRGAVIVNPIAVVFNLLDYL